MHTSRASIVTDTSNRPTHDRALRAGSRRGVVRSRVVAGVLATAMVLAGAGRAHALFHIAVIDELMTGLSGSEAVQFVEIRMLAGSQNIVSDSKLSAFDANGDFLRVVLTVPANVTGGSDRAWIMASTDFAAAAGITPDFTFNSLGGLGLETTDGMVCWGKPADQTNPAQYVDCVAYGNYVGPSNIHTSAPSPIAPFGHSLVRVSETQNNAVDFVCNDPAEPENNAMAVGSIAATEPCPVCGNDVAETPEHCDGIDDGACPGLCQLDCTCATDCGNDVAELGEECDGVDDGACPGLCQVNCTCGPDGPIDSAAQKCANAAAKASSKVVKSYGKAATGCVSAFTGGKTVDAPAVCVAADPKQKLAKEEAKTQALIEKSCPPAGLAWAVDCPAPCETTDDGGATQSVDDRDELVACLDCIDRAVSITAAGDGGNHGGVLDGVTLATSSGDAALAKCQAKLVGAHEKLFAARIKEAVKCAKTELKDGSTPPIGAICIGADPKSKVGKARSKLDATASLCGSPAPFDAGRCAALTGAAISDCMAGVSACQACVWGNTVFGSDVDCDLADNLLADASCP